MRTSFEMLKVCHYLPLFATIQDFDEQSLNHLIQSFKILNEKLKLRIQ